MYRDLTGGCEVPATVVVLHVAHERMKNNNYLVVDPVTRQAVLVDPAWEIGKIEAALAAEQAVLCGILITHSHPDHINLAKPLSELYGCPIWMSKREIEVSGFRAERLVGIDETPWVVGNLTITPLLTPGHTPGCVCYQIGEELFTGDVLFVEGCGICQDVASAHAMFDSLSMLKRRLSPLTRIYPGHTYDKPPGLTFDEVFKRNIYLQFRDKDSFAAYRLRKGQSAKQLFAFR
ncbi:beta-lactamase domain-containing protein [Caballeronia udeis]|uniref:Beta-lactamase domain-containing protein n=1 Tax=Caballeronia udeis TaxID=1232866 RepID=A0A158GLD2_9BURK|nr:MBL fold metallo-hydrolase [Caballeronia udeis]SAL32886.1 beta-lactamase domain-containing protein [Caballeronia udeis]